MQQNENEIHNQDLPLSQLPAEMLLYILSFVDYETLCSMREVSRLLTSVSTDDALWKTHIQKECRILDIERRLKSGESHFEFFKRHFAYWQTNITLNAQGDHLSLNVFAPNESELRPAMVDDSIHLLLKEGLVLSSRESMLVFLKKLEANRGCLRYVSLTLDGNALRGGSKKCTIEDMIEKLETVQEKITPAQAAPSHSSSVCILS